MKSNKTGLGRGLDALISIDDTTNEQFIPSSINEIDLDSIHANSSQPRHDFDQQALEELAESIKSIGIIQPITLRQEEDGTYMIVAGERRYRAAKIAGLQTIPAYIRKVSDDDVMEMALIENIQREDLNAIEVALAYQQLQLKQQCTQEELAQRVGKSRAAVANFMRLLKLPAEVQLAIKGKTLSMGHARAIIPVEEPEQQVKLYHIIAEQDLSVRKVEALVKDYLEGRILDFADLANPQKPNKPKKQETVSSPEILQAMQEHLSKMFSAKVKMICNDKGQGRITIPFKTDGELQHILQLLDSIK
ncbi:MAG: ParB/RepB/Spo0J family partition protein [Bacteroidales bacterium]|nr:ParB/RepB/Spo0J family partition protein [Bacteroidales bacterium]